MLGSRSPVEWWTAALVSAIAWLALSSPWLGGHLTIPYDAKAHFQAQLQFLATALHSGQSPFWTPNVFAGSPQVADPQSLIFSPALLLAYFSAQPTFTQLDGYVLVLLGIGAGAILMFFKDRSWHPVGAVVAALAFAFGASAAWRIQHFGQIQSYALFGTTLWMLARTLERRSYRCAIGAGLSAGLMIAEPNQVALLAAYVLVIYAIWHLVDCGDRIVELKSIFPMAAVALVSCALVAVIPTGLAYLFVEQSSRPAVPLTEAAHGSLHPASILTAVVGDLYGALDPKVEYWGPYSVSWSPSDLTLSQNMSQVYFGIIPALLILSVGVVRGAAWHKEIRPFTVSLLVVLLYAVGTYTPVFALAYQFLPGVDLFRRPADATFMLGALGAIVGGYLCHRLASGGLPQASLRRRAIELLSIAAAFAASLAVAVSSGHGVDAIKPLLTATTLLAAALAVLRAIIILAKRHVVAAIAIAGAFMTVDLALNNGPNESTALSAAQYEILRPNCENETVRFLKAHLRQPRNSSRRDRVELVGLGFAWPNLGLVHGFDHVLGYNPLRLEAADKAMGAGDTIAGWEQRRFTPLFPSYRSLLADMLGLRFIAAPLPIDRIDRSLKPGDLIPVARTPDAFIYENPRAMPRVLFVEHWMRADFGLLTATGQWPAFDPYATVLLEDEQDADSKIAAGAVTARPLGNAAIAHFENTQVSLDVTSARAGFVVMNSAWHPWWRATVDGKEAKLLKANVMFRAIPVPVGRHRVQLSFEPLEGAMTQIARWARPPTLVHVGSRGPFYP